MTKNIWSREELILALNLYLKIPFGQMHHRNPDVINLAGIINRTPGSVAMRLGNFAHIDPYHQQRGIHGLSGGRKQVQPIWDEFINNREELLFESEKILAERQKTNLEIKFLNILQGTEHLNGETKIREIKTRINQHTFRKIVLVNYSQKCAISEIDIPEILLACHIIPWSIDTSNRLNPQNGICLSPLYEKCFDRGLISIDTNYKIRLSSIIQEKYETAYYNIYFKNILNKKITMPLKFLPKKEFLEYHIENIFQK